LSGVLSADLFGLFDPLLVESGLFEPLLGFGFRLPGFPAVLEPADFSLGREVRNAPRTSPSSCTIGAATPTTKAQTQTSPKTMTLNRIAESPYRAAKG
jgi:hypothetical protein